MAEREEKNPYETVPYKGNEFQEGGATFRWIFGTAAVGTEIDRTQVEHYNPRQVRVDGEERWISDYFRYRVHQKVVENAMSSDGNPIIKWQYLEGHRDRTKIGTGYANWMASGGVTYTGENGEPLVYGSKAYEEHQKLRAEARKMNGDPEVVGLPKLFIV